MWFQSVQSIPNRLHLFSPVGWGPLSELSHSNTGNLFSFVKRNCGFNHRTKIDKLCDEAANLYHEFKTYCTVNIIMIILDRHFFFKDRMSQRRNFLKCSMSLDGDKFSTNKKVVFVLFMIMTSIVK